MKPWQRPMTLSKFVFFFFFLLGPGQLKQQCIKHDQRTYCRRGMLDVHWNMCVLFNIFVVLACIIMYYYDLVCIIDKLSVSLAKNQFIISLCFGRGFGRFRDDMTDQILEQSPSTPNSAFALFVLLSHLFLQAMLSTKSTSRR